MLRPVVPTCLVLPILPSKLKKIVFHCIVLSNFITDAHRTRITCARPRLDIRKYFFCTRIVDNWNALDIDMSVFKTARHFAKYLRERGVED